jgi:hypothetical protein
MTENPPVREWGDAIQAWSDRWRKADPLDVDAALAQGLSLCDPVIDWATSLLARAAERPLNPKHLLLLRAILGSWTSMAGRVRRRLPAGQDVPALTAAIERSCASIRALADAQAAIEAALPREPERNYLTQQEVRDAIRLRRAMGG